MPHFDEDDDHLDLNPDDLFSSKHIDAIRKQAIECMDHFFCDKKYWAGGDIPDKKLYSEDHIRAVMSINTMDAHAVAYFCLARDVPDNIDIKKKNWEIYLCLDNVIDQCRKRFIPKSNRGGMLLVYLSVCHGVEFLPTLKKLAQIRAEIERQEREAEIKLLMKEQKEDDNN